ncbi:hypothetical protein FOL47_010573 [Perkinsus chesapeaki]|uniref:Uncharacterized protein n=1 Tax=Perkinsus chesapeaki TaxID=330153 RepID=A0A7J6MR27_PERCH|nr:hypothetical protein FOL47_010573 [Perkinsus chesapeaki]
MEKKRNAMIENTKNLSEMSDWIVHADSDQFHEIPGNNIDSFLRSVEDEGYNAVYGNYVDRVAQDGSLPLVSATPTIFSQFPLACDVTKKIVGIDVPQKVLAFRAFLRANRGGGKVKDESLACVYPTLLKSHHFKWVKQVKEKLERRVETADILLATQLAEGVLGPLWVVMSRYKRKGYGWWRQSANVLEHLKQHNSRLCVNCSELSCIIANTTEQVSPWGDAMRVDICPAGRHAR